MRKEMIKFEEINEEIILFDCYGSLLTEKQQEIFSLYYHENYSFGEISDIMGITRQGAHEQLKKARTTLDYFESKLGIAKKFQENEKAMDRINVLLEDMKKNVNDRDVIFSDIEKVKKIIGKLSK